MHASTVGIVIFALLSASCSQINAGSVYSPASGNMWHYGFSETQLAKDTFRVTFLGYGIPQAKAYDFALLRAAELCRANGFTHFNLISENSSAGIGPGVIIPSGSAAIYSSIDKPEVTLTAKFSNEPSSSYSVAFLEQSLRKKHKIE